MNTIQKMRQDPSFLETYSNDPKLKKIFQKFPFVKEYLQKPEEIFVPQIVQMVQNALKEDDKKIIESSGTEISVPPDPFGNLDIIQNNQMMNSSSQISNINSFNKNSSGNKENFGNCEIDIDYKEKYKDQLSQLKSMGFSNEEINIQALNNTNGNIENAIDKILEKNN